jgi:hypothetical protein
MITQMSAREKDIKTHKLYFWKAWSFNDGFFYGLVCKTLIKKLLAQKFKLNDILGWQS